MHNLASQTGLTAISVNPSGVFINDGGRHFGASGEKIIISGYYQLKTSGAKLEFDTIDVRNSGRLDWDIGDIDTDVLKLQDTSRWEISGNASFADTLTMRDTSEIELRGTGGVLTTLTLTSTSSVLMVAGTIDGNLITSATNINLDGEIEITGTLSQLAAGKITAELGPGTASGKFTVTGTASLAGDLVLDLDGGYTPAAGDTFTLITASSISGTFDMVTVPTLSNDLTVKITYNAGSVVARVEIPGDLNTDGFVGIDDLNNVLSNWNQTVTPGDLLLGDPSGDGFVGIEDFNVMLSNWNKGVLP